MNEARTRPEKADTGTTGMTHAALTASVYMCGAPRDPSRPFVDIPTCDCIVCYELWWALTPDERIEIKRRRGSL